MRCIFCYNIINEIFLRKEAGMMTIKYDKLFALLKEKGYSSYRLRKEKLVGQSILQKLRDGGDIDTRTIKRFCALLDCQPGDIMEYAGEDTTAPKDLLSLDDNE